MVNIVHKGIWITIHSLFSLIGSIIQLVELINTVLRGLWNSHLQILEESSNSSDKDKAIIEQSKKQLTKIPKHILVVLGDEQPNFQFMANLVSWSTFTGVNCISFYDYKDSFTSKHNESFKSYLQSKINNFNILWNFQNGNLCSGYIPYKNGSTRNTTINFLNHTYGTQQISNVCRNICTNSVNHKTIDINYLDKLLIESFNGLPDPDLAFCFGNSYCTYGALPWQIRLTEFYRTKSQSCVNLQIFLSALYSFAKCDQRHGK